MSKPRMKYKHLVRKSECGDAFYLFSSREGDIKFCPFCGENLEKSDEDIYNENEKEIK